MSAKLTAPLLILAFTCSADLEADSGRRSAPGGETPSLVSLEIEPSEFTLHGRWSSQRLLALGQLSDGTLRDLTSTARFRSENDEIATVNDRGVVTPASDGSTTLAVTVDAGDSRVSATVHVTVTRAGEASVSFVRDVMPLLNKLGCNAAKCHGSLKGKSGFKLSLFGAYPEQDHTALARSAGGRRVNRVEPEESLFLLKATETVSHKGGKKVERCSREYDLLASWVAQGASRSDSREPGVVSMEVYPHEPLLRKGQTRRLLVTAVLSDGTRRDVTGRAHFQSSDESTVEVDENGKLEAKDHGEAAVVVSYMRRSTIARAVIPHPLDFPFPDLEPNNRIDQLVFDKLEKLGIPPSDLSADHEFLRRVYLDVIGILPTTEETLGFLSDPDPAKRAKLIDRLLERGEFADFWALKWGDLLRIKSEYPSNLWPNAVQAYHQWVRESIATNKPYDVFVRELLTSSGSNFRDPPANYFRALRKRDAQGFADVTALIFMGARIGCARCHGHPLEEWTLEDNLGLAAFFSNVVFKRTQEWKEEVVYVRPGRALRHPRTGEPVAPRFPGGEGLTPARDEDPRARFAAWLTSTENPWFAANIVNRIWFWLNGRGIVHAPDDLRPTNPATNPQLLSYLEEELIEHRYDLRHIFRLILNSKTYQLSSRTNRWNADDDTFFSHYRIRRMGAEQLLDAIGQVTETAEKFMSRIPEPFTVLPEGHRATQLADASIGTPFLELFGRPPRDTPYEEERCSDVSMRQALHLINSSHLEAKVMQSSRIRRFLEQRKGDAEIVDEIYLAALSRFPVKAEKQKVLSYLSRDRKARRQAIQDLMWAILNTKEFVFNH